MFHDMPQRGPLRPRPDAGDHRSRPATEAEGPTGSVLDRRSALKKVGVAGAIAWMAPTVISLHTPAAAASCPGGVVDWVTGGFSAGQPGALANYPWTVGTYNGTTVTFSWQNGTAPAVLFGGTGTGAQPAVTLGGITGVFQIRKNSAAHNGSAILWIAFSPAAVNLAFTIMDIDLDTSGSSNYTDEVRITPFTNPTGPTRTEGTFTPLGTTTLSPSTPDTANEATYTGTVPVASSSPDGSLGVSIPGPVSRVRIRYRSTQSGTGTNQWIGISNIAWNC